MTLAAACTTPILCAIQDLTDAVRTDPWPVFWLTLAATFVGAVVGAGVAYLGTLDLNRRERLRRVAERTQDRLDREAERAQAIADRQVELAHERSVRQSERDHDQHARAEERLDVAVALVVERLGTLDAAGRAFTFAMHVRQAGVSVEPPHGARAQLLASVRVAQMNASPQDMAPLDATFEVITAQDDRSSEQRALDYQNAADTLAEWRRGLLTGEDAALKIRYRPQPQPPADDDA